MNKKLNIRFKGVYMKKLLIGILALTSMSTFAADNYKLMYKCKVLGESTLAQEVSIFGNFTSGETENQPGLVIISDDSKAKALSSKISLQDDVHPWRKATVVVPSVALGYQDTDLAMTIDLTKSTRVGFRKKANGLIGLVKAGTLSSSKLENMSCEHIF
jgi:hypothetical protein